MAIRITEVAERLKPPVLKTGGSDTRDSVKEQTAYLRQGRNLA